ncbi:hypothetical protein MMC18_005978 [Xylographa bjoerkii]|nr:hypothetical protein [Xylographa bjoerkii]
MRASDGCGLRLKPLFVLCTVEHAASYTIEAQSQSPITGVFSDKLRRESTNPRIQLRHLRLTWLPNSSSTADTRRTSFRNNFEETLDRKVTTPGNMSKASEAANPTYLRMVTIKVGPKAKIYRYSRDLLTKKVPWFAKALDGKFKEGQSKEGGEETISLPEEEPAVFDLFLAWLHTGLIPAVRGAYFFHYLESGMDRSADSLRVFEISYHRLGYMAEKFILPELQNVVLNGVYAAKKCGEHTLDTSHAWFTNLRKRDELEIQEFLVDVLELAAYMPGFCSTLVDPDTVDVHHIVELRKILRKF